MKKFLKSLPVRLIIGVALGILIGLAANESVMNVVVTIKYVLGQVITFCVPLIIIGFIAPSITKLGNHASRMLGVALAIAYLSSIGAAFMSMGAGYGIIPHLSIQSEVEGLKELPDVIFKLDIPQIMSVMSALVFSVMIGLSATWTKARTVTAILDEFQKIVLQIVTKFIIPILPFFIAATFCGLAYEGTITKQVPVFLKVIVIVMAGHYIWLTLLYAGRCLFQKESAGSTETLWSCLSDSSRNHVQCSNSGGCPEWSKKIKSSEKRYGGLWYSAVCQYSSVRFCTDRGIFCYDRITDSLWTYAIRWYDGTVLSASWCLCNRCTGCAGRNGYGFSWSDYRCITV